MVPEQSSPDVRDFRELCASGLLYHDLAQMMNDKGHKLFDLIPKGDRCRYAKNRAISRDDTKVGFLVMAYCELDMMQQMPLYGCFRERFPHVAEFMVDQKRHDHAQLAKSCQTEEARLMIDGAAANLLARFPDEVVLSVHDAILTTRHLMDEARTEIERQFKALGVTPKVKQT